MSDRWEGSSFKDSVEAAVHYALIEHLIAIKDREFEQGKHSDLSDIYIQTRRLVRGLCDGSVDPDEYLDSRE